MEKCWVYSYNWKNQEDELVNGIQDEEGASVTVKSVQELIQNSLHYNLKHCLLTLNLSITTTYYST